MTNYFIFAGENKFGDKRLDSATQYLHNAGLILHFGNDTRSSLSKWVITDPQFLMKVFACVVTKKHRFVSEGKFVARGVKWMFQPLHNDYSITPGTASPHLLLSTALTWTQKCMNSYWSCSTISI